ncbi:ESCRT-II complex subunit-domain-containing protein [Hyaloraphidium curvatum]|nr:ESCRT-II complex subunit-domain-containing protein [Hyaloraphidium curvatum]
MDAPPGYQFPSIHDFPPFYTLQPNLDTRQKQLQLWGDVVLSFCRAAGVTVMDLAEWEGRGGLFRNEKLRRYLPLDGIRAVMDDLAARGRAEYLDPARLRCAVWWRRPEEWASALHAHAASRGLGGSIVTVYEVQHGDLWADQDFRMLDEVLMMRVLDILSKQGKATVFQGNDYSESGIKFA